jgi:predicted GNAT family acetyltransferase
MASKLNRLKSILNSNYNIHTSVNHVKKTIKLVPKNRNINKNSNKVYSLLKNKNNTLEVSEMWTNYNFAGRGFQKKLLTAAINAAKRSGYKRMNAVSIHAAPEPGNVLPKLPPSSYIFRKFRFYPTYIRNKPHSARHVIAWAKNL